MSQTLFADLVLRYMGRGVVTVKGDFEGHPFRGNQYGAGQGGGAGDDNSFSESDYPSSEAEFFNENYQPGFTVPEARPGDSKEKVKSVARDLVSSAVSSPAGGSAYASRQDHADFITEWAKRALKDDPFTVTQHQSSGSKWEIRVKRIRRSYQ